MTTGMVGRISSTIGLATALMTTQGCGTPAQLQGVGSRSFVVTLTYAFGGADGEQIIELPRLARSSGGVTVEFSVPDGAVDTQNRVMLQHVQPHRTVVDSTTESTVTYVSWNGRHPLDDERCYYRGKHSDVEGVDIFESDRWGDPELACLAKEVALRDATALVAVRGGEVRSVSVSFEEPDEAMFEIPESFEERSPSQVREELARRRPDLCDTDCLSDPALTSLDEAYSRSQSGF